MKLIYTIAFGVVVIFATGCQSMPKSFDQGLTLIEKAADLAEKQGIAYSATIRWDGKIGGAWIQRAEVDSGVTVEASFHGNAAAERPAVKIVEKPDP